MATDEAPADGGADAQVKPFAQLLRELRRGGVHTEMSDGMQALVAACTETGKKGTLTLKLTVSPQKDGDTYLVTDDVKVAAPRPTYSPSMFFADGDSNLVRQDPRQMDMGELQAVPAPTTGPLRDINDQTGTSS